MKRSLIFCLVMLMLGFVPVCGGNVTHSTENLVFGEMWMEFGREHYAYDKNFRSVSEYAEKKIYINW